MQPLFVTSCLVRLNTSSPIHLALLKTYLYTFSVSNYNFIFILLFHIKIRQSRTTGAVFGNLRLPKGLEKIPQQICRLKNMFILILTSKL